MNDDKAPAPSPRQRRSIKSFIKREGRLTRGQASAIERLFPLYGLCVEDFAGRTFDSKEVFSNDAPVVLEIGFGDGEALIEMARSRPEHNFIGIEVHRPGVGHLLLRMEQEELSNIRVFSSDAVEVLGQVLPDNSLLGICLFFPDPWPKKKHHKRRIISGNFMALVGRKLKSGGQFHFATDWQDYAEQAIEVIESCGFLDNVAESGSFSERPQYRPLTKFERRGLRRGHGVWDVVMVRNGHS